MDGRLYRFRALKDPGISVLKSFREVLSRMWRGFTNRPFMASPWTGDKDRTLRLDLEGRLLRSLSVAEKVGSPRTVSEAIWFALATSFEMSLGSSISKFPLQATSSCSCSCDTASELPSHFVRIVENHYNIA